MNHVASHLVVCAAPAGTVYDLVTNPAEWPQLLGPCEATEVISSTPQEQVVLITVRMNGRLASWTSRRRLLPEVFGVEAELVRPMPLVEHMRTSWRVFELDADSSVLLVEHSYTLSSDIDGQVPGVHTEAAAAGHVAAILDTNSDAELADYRAAAASHRPRTASAASGAGPAGSRQHLRHAAVCAAGAAAAYRLIRDTTTWPELFSACTGVEVLDTASDWQLVRVHADQGGRAVWWDTRRRYLDPIRRIDYELVVPMPFVREMSGEWRVLELGDGRSLLVVDRWWTMLDDVTGIRDGIDTVTQALDYVRSYVDGNAAAEMEVIAARVAREAAEPAATLVATSAGTGS